MTKEEFRDSISLYIDGDLSSVKMQEFEEILNNDQELQTYYNQVASIVNNMSQIETIKASEDFMDGLRIKIDQYSNSPTSTTTAGEIVLEGTGNTKGFKVFGFDPLPVLGIAAALIMSFQIFSSFRSNDLPTLSVEDSIEIDIINPKDKTEFALSDSDSLNQVEQSPEEREENNFTPQRTSLKKITN